MSFFSFSFGLARISQHFFVILIDIASNSEKKENPTTLKCASQHTQIKLNMLILRTRHHETCLELQSGSTLLS